MKDVSDPRKLIKFGPSSYIISIPKSWIERHKLCKGDIIYCTRSNNDELILAHQQKEIKREPRSAIINIDKKSIKDIKREFLSSYIAGFDIIKLEAEQDIKFSNELRDIIRELTTLDIIEQNKHAIVAKDFLNLEKISLEELIRRMDLILRSMIGENKFYSNKTKLNKV